MLHRLFLGEKAQVVAHKAGATSWQWDALSRYSSQQDGWCYAPDGNARTPRVAGG